MKYVVTSGSLRMLLGILTISIFFTSCESTCDETIVAETAGVFDPPSTADFEALQNNSFDQLLQIVTLDVGGNGLIFNAPSGVNIFIAANCLSINGDQVMGNVDLEFVEIYDRGDMLTSNSTTVGMFPAGGSELLVSGGMFFFNITQNGQQVDLVCDGTITVPTDLTGGTDPAMRPFDGSVNAQGDIEWLETQAELFITPSPIGDIYNTFFSEFGWFNCDRFYNAPDPKTEIMVAIPQEFSQENSNVYLALQGEPNSLAYLYGEFPVGLDAHIIFVSEEEGNFRYAIRTLTLEENQQVIFTLQETTVATLEEITNAINFLQ